MLLWSGKFFNGTDSAGPAPDLTYALLLSSIDELDPPAGLLLSGDQQPTGIDILELSGDQR
ncbi:hypothetical protein [Mesorhizobium sp.]|uniref:hypothetical protein n=1 Tax=Mesorhizobium sp. TaxID=1871066 RepID=UPI000FEAB17B|nr:hypothetical protein [Mesorhizobium sp.]RWN58768.1 MAG: hypothetical protein EOS00_20485 [Mesorhizobium sp.]